MPTIETTMVSELPPADSIHCARVGKYLPIFRQAIQNPDSWFRVDPAVIAGDTRHKKQIALHTSANRQGLRITTRLREGFMYIQYVGLLHPETKAPAKTNYETGN